MFKQILLLTILILSISPILAQVPQKIQIGADGNPIITPEMEASIRKYQETYRNLDTYAFFSAKVKDLNGLSKNDAVRISKRELNDIKFDYFIENKTQTPFDLVFNDASAMIRPELRQNGKIIDYSKEMEKRVCDKDEKAAAYHVDKITFSPAIKNKVPDFAGIRNLRDWYDPLEIGYYELTFKFVYGRDDTGKIKALLSQPIYFEVLPD